MCVCGGVHGCYGEGGQLAVSRLVVHARGKVGCTTENGSSVLSLSHTCAQRRQIPHVSSPFSNRDPAANFCRTCLCSTP